ncbi:Hypothetical protein NTJ_05778 [Nesidiocoris tenuis]|uniref:Uncharacterized protein n=1 Tax=Nesidiocoris tenuis TaxID=355587 RepID=A0ABN7ANY7_9HEMI|nr:Hypothetical protein NTJ_05778 [Nesidiocoris tenuis]
MAISIGASVPLALVTLMTISALTSAQELRSSGFVSAGPGAFRNPVLSAAGGYGLAFVSPASYGQGNGGAYTDGSFGPNFGQRFATGPEGVELGPGRYAFPVFDHNQGFGGFGALGYYGHNLGFAYPGYGYGAGIFGARAYANPFV